MTEQVSTETKPATSDKVAVFPKMPASQYANGRGCRGCGAKGETPITPIRFGDFWRGVVVPLCDACLELTRAALAKVDGKS